MTSRVQDALDSAAEFPGPKALVNDILGSPLAGRRATLDAGDALDRPVLPAGTRPLSAGDAGWWKLGSFVLFVHVKDGAQPGRGIARLIDDADGEWWIFRVADAGAENADDEGLRADHGEIGVFLGSTLRPPGDALPGLDRVTLVFRADVDPALDAALTAHGHGRLTGPGAEVLGRIMLSLADMLPIVARDELPRLAEVLRTVLLALLPLAGARSGRNHQCSSRALLRTRVDTVIAKNIVSARLDPTRIARLARISRTTLYRLFEKDGGVAAYLRLLRLERVRAALCDPDHASVPIAALAARNGLHCVASFNRSFRRVYGITPGEMRAEALARGETPPPGAASPVSATALRRGRHGDADAPCIPDNADQSRETETTSERAGSAPTRAGAGSGRGDPAARSSAAKAKDV